jgi:hypothetical protein
LKPAPCVTTLRTSLTQEALVRTLKSVPLSLLTQPEARLVLASAPRNLAGLSRQDATSKAKQARRLSTKYRGLARRQGAQARRRAPPRGAKRAEGSENTERKAAIFADAQRAFEGRLHQLDQKPKAKARPRAKAGAARRPARRAASRKAVVAGSRALKRDKPVSAKGQAPKSPHRTKMFGVKRVHVRAGVRTRRFQAKKDSR